MFAFLVVVFVIIVIIQCVVLFSQFRPFVIVPAATWVVTEKIGHVPVARQPGFHVLSFPTEFVRSVRWKRSEDRRPFCGPAIPQGLVRFDPPSWSMTLRDKTAVEVDTLFYVKIVDCCAAVTKVDDLYASVEAAAQTATVDVVCRHSLDECQDQRSVLRERILAAFNEKVSDIGVSVASFEIQAVSPPPALRAFVQETEMNVSRQRAKLEARRRADGAEMEHLEHTAEMKKKELEMSLMAERTELEMSKLKAEAKAMEYRAMREAGASEAYLAALVHQQTWADAVKGGKATTIMPFDAAPFAAISRLMRGPSSGAHADADAGSDDGFVRA